MAATTASVEIQRDRVSLSCRRRRSPTRSAASARYISTAVEGDTVAFAVNGRPPCGGVYINGRKISDRCDDASGHARRSVRGLARAARRRRRSITVADVATGAIVATFPAGARLGRVRHRRARQHRRRAEQRARRVHPHRPDASACWRKAPWSSSVATAGGRVAYISPTTSDRPEPPVRHRPAGQGAQAPRALRQAPLARRRDRADRPADRVERAARRATRTTPRRAPCGR